MLKEDIENLLTGIVGKNAFENGNMQVSDDVARLAKAVNYLVTQLKIVSNEIEDEELSELKDYISKVLYSVKDILEKK